MKYADTKGKDFCVTWLPDGKSFVIKNPDEFTRHVVPKYFKATKFSSFTRKLYRWGFRQINRGIGPDDPIIFGNEHFDRDNEHLISKMRSITAAACRKQDPPHQTGGSKRPPELEPAVSASSNKQRLLIDQLIHQKAANLLQHKPGMYMGMNGISLTSALRPDISQEHPHSGRGGPIMNPTSSAMASKFDAMTQQQQLLLQQHPNSLMNQYNMPSHMIHTLPYPQPHSAAEIVNAAIAALRYAN